MLGTRLYVGNLDFGVDDAGLYELFSTFGQVNSAQVMVDRDSGQAKGFGFVEMASETDAQKSIDQGNGLEHEGRVLTVNEARPRESHGSASSSGTEYRPKTRWLSKIIEKGPDGDGYRVESDGYVSSVRKPKAQRKRGRRHR